MSHCIIFKTLLEQAAVVGITELIVCPESGFGTLGQAARRDVKTNIMAAVSCYPSLG